MNIAEWCHIDEIIHSAETGEQYLQFAGFEYNRKTMENLSKMKALISEIFIKTFSEPKILLMSAIENISESKTKGLELKLHELRETRIRSRELRFNGKYVNRNSSRQFNSCENDHSKRKIVFDEFVAKTKYISPIINLRFKKIRDLFQLF